MAKVVDKVLVHTENGMEEVFKPSDGEPMKVKIMQMTVTEKPLANDKMETARTYINNTIALADSALETRKAMVIIDYRNRLNAAQGVGDVIKGIMKFIPGPPNPMIEKLGELEDKIKKIGENMSDHFSEIKSFISEVKFSVKVMSPTLVLIKCMRDCLKFPGPYAVHNFREAYKKHSPLMLAYTCMSYLEQKSTNPLRMAMETEKVKTKATFQKWENIFNQLLRQFLFLEAFATGLLGTKSDYNLDVLVSRADEIGKQVAEWKSEIEKDEEYWTEIKGLLENYIPNHENLTNEQKAKEIAAQLDTYLTSDAFHVVVFNEADPRTDYTYYCPNEKTQMYGVWGKGKCNAFIYRSLKGNQMNESDYKQLETQVHNCGNKTLELSKEKPLSTMIKTQLIDTKRVRSDGLIFMAENERHVWVVEANCTKFSRGPGYYNNVELDVKLTSSENLSQKLLLLSFP